LWDWLQDSLKTRGRATGYVPNTPFGLLANHCAGKAKRLCFANPFFGLPYAIGLQGSLKRGRGSLSYGIRSPRLGRVGIQLLLQILRQKAVDARQKYEPMPFIGECF